jgi:release factor glutamine methyltransferase
VLLDRVLRIVQAKFAGLSGLDISRMYLPVTVLEAIQRGTDFLLKRGVESARLNTELLLAHALKLPRLKLYLDFQRILSEEEVAATRELVQRRGAREPLQQIIGSTSFCGLEITVTPQVLIPRSETELLAEKAWLYLNALGRPGKVLDVATGSGCISVSIASQSPQAVIHASDISVPALEVARENAKRLHFSERVQFHHSDLFQNLPSDLVVDLIVSNPPYIPTAEIELLAPEVRQFDPLLALDGGADGLDFFRLFAKKAQFLLSEHGRLMLEFGDGQAPALVTLFEGMDWSSIEIAKDYTGRARILIAERPQG